MKTFTRIALTIAGLLTSVAIICGIIALSMGIKPSAFVAMVENGKFSFDMLDLIDLKETLVYSYIFGEDDSDDVGGTGVTTISPTDCKKIKVEYGAGTLEIEYGDVSEIEIYKENVKNFNAKIEDDTLEIEAETKVYMVGINSAGTLQIVLPKDMKLEELELEIGATEAVIEDVQTDKFFLEVGAGQAEIIGLVAENVEVAAGAAQVDMSDLVTKNINLEVGAGEVNLFVIGAETDYNYSVECAIGEVVIGDSSYGGIGAEQKVTNEGAIGNIDVECGVGQVTIEFQ